MEAVYKAWLKNRDKMMMKKPDGIPSEFKDGAVEREIAQDLAEIKAMEEEISHFEKETIKNDRRIWYERG